MFNLNEFESNCCKGLSIVLVILLAIISFQLVGCTSASNGAINVIPKEEVHDTIRNFPLLDTRGVLHKYRDDFDKFIFPRHNEKLTQYCGKHFEWESIKAVYKKEGDGDYRWHYIVSRSKKQ